MSGHTRGKRSPVTCHLKCGDACSQPVPNRSANETFRDIASRAFSRRALLGGAAAGTAAIVVGDAVAGGAAPASASFFRDRLPFTPIAPVPNTVDAFTVPAGYSWHPIIRWGDPLFSEDDAFDPANQTGERQSRQFGYNCDYLDVLALPGARTGVLVANHEYTNENIMFPPAADAAQAEEQKRVAIAAHGMSVVEVKRRGAGKPWSYVVGGRLNRRITSETPFTFSGPAARDPLLQTVEDPTGTTARGTFNNCAGGTTPWGTVLSGEENFNQYFKAAGTPDEQRYGLGASGDARGWATVDPRFDGVANPGYANEPNRFGWIVEIDPLDPDSTPVKHTAMGRLKHEGANVQIGRSGHVAAYTGDDERFDYLYKFVSRQKFRLGISKRVRDQNKQLLADGDLYVARFTGDSPIAEITGTGAVPSDGAFDGTGEWIPLVVGGESRVPGMTTAEVLVFTRRAGDVVGATKMDRPEDVQPNPLTGRVYVACTNNTDRGKAGKAGPDEVNPRTNNRDGHVIEITESGNDVRSLTFGWSILLLAGNPATNPGTYFAGYPADKVSPISCPDNLAFDASGNLWISTDGQPGTIGFNDGLFKVPLTGSERGHVQQFLAVPAEAETCGPVIHDLDGKGSVFVAVQHPGENGSWDAQHSFFPDYTAPGSLADGDWGGPRPSVVQVVKD
ncbi:PhoX family phosphatase [Agromyces sp. LHK192]|uniref:PhoX family protein n=1 Tax=Agromyces sp. LHK192 TaxID=2498704 RepID=UPI000FD94A97|nr:PhoX family phosphatase [Agromyces sp. LHK192]